MLLNFILQNTVGRMVKKLAVDLIWRSMLEPFTSGVMWSVLQITYGIGKLIHGFFMFPPVYNFFTDIARIPIGMADALDGMINSLIKFSHNSEVGKVCTKCNILAGKKYVRTFFENAITISLLGFLVRHFYNNINSACASFKEYNDARQNAGVGLESHAQNSYFANSTLWFCVGVQSFAFAMCAFSALSANQSPRNKFVLAGTLGASELIMRGFSGLMSSSMNDLSAFKAKIEDLEKAKTDAESKKKTAEGNYELAVSGKNAAIAAKEANEKTIVRAMWALRFADNFMDQVVNDDSIAAMTTSDNAKIRTLGQQLAVKKIEFSTQQTKYLQGGANIQM